MSLGDTIKEKVKYFFFYKYSKLISRHFVTA